MLVELGRQRPQATESASSHGELSLANYRGIGDGDLVIGPEAEGFLRRNNLPDIQIYSKPDNTFLREEGMDYSPRLETTVTRADSAYVVRIPDRAILRQSQKRATDEFPTEARFLATFQEEIARATERIFKKEKAYQLRIATTTLAGFGGANGAVWVFTGINPVTVGIASAFLIPSAVGGTVEFRRYLRLRDEINYLRRHGKEFVQYRNP